MLRRAAAGQRVRPTPALADLLEFITTGRQPAGSSQTAVFCGDHAVDRDPATHWRAVNDARRTDPVLGPLVTNNNPCAFWPTAPLAPPTVVRNAVPALIVDSTGDARIHAVYPRYAKQSRRHKL